MPFASEPKLWMAFMYGKPKTGPVEEFGKQGHRSHIGIVRSHAVHCEGEKRGVGERLAQIADRTIDGFIDMAQRGRCEMSRFNRVERMSRVHTMP